MKGMGAFSWLWEVPCPILDERFPLREGRDRHRLVVQFARDPWRKRGNLTIRVESREHRSISQDGSYPFHFFIGMLLEDQLSPHATDEHREIWRATKHVIARLRRAYRPIHQSVEIGSHEASVHSLRNISGKRNALLSLVDRQNRPYNRGRTLWGEQTQWEEQPCSGQATRMLTEIGFIHRQDRLAIELVEHIARRTSN